MTDQPLSLIRQLREHGYTLEAVGEKLRITPTDVPSELLQKLILHRDGVLALIRHELRHCEQDVSRLESLRAFMPNIWKPVRLPDGSQGILWGITPRGVLAHRFPGGPILCYEPDEVQLIE